MAEKKKTTVPAQRKKLGRKSMYDPSMNEQARKLALLGLTDKEIASYFGVTDRTLNNWKKEFPAFFQSLNAGKIEADADVADSLYRRAKGEVVFVEKRVKNDNGNYEIIRLSQSVPSDPGAAKLWLTNRQPDKWRDKREVDVNHAYETKSDDELRTEYRQMLMRGGMTEEQATAAMQRQGYLQ